MSARRTPPPGAGPSNLQLTPEQVRKFEENRLRGALRHLAFVVVIAPS